MIQFKCADGVLVVQQEGEEPIPPGSMGTWHHRLWLWPF